MHRHDAENAAALRHASVQRGGGGGGLPSIPGIEHPCPSRPAVAWHPPRPPSPPPLPADRAQPAALQRLLHGAQSRAASPSRTLLAAWPEAVTHDCRMRHASASSNEPCWRPCSRRSAASVRTWRLPSRAWHCSCRQAVHGLGGRNRGGLSSSVQLSYRLPSPALQLLVSSPALGGGVLQCPAQPAPGVAAASKLAAECQGSHPKRAYSCPC